jgi:NAD(P)-dependent dehydrogenase (short-subunit alcohol dehydrogenase family)
MNKLNIIVTGASNGLGASICEALGNAGHMVYGFDLELGDDIRKVKDSYWIQGVNTDIDVLINCAGINSNEWFEDVTLEKLQDVMNVNAFGPALLVQALLPKLIKTRGTVINIVSNAAHIPMTSSLAYNMSKAAALMMTRQLAHELTPKYGISVFSISPNKLEGTKMSRQIEDNVCKVRGWTPEFAAEYQKKGLMKGLETPPQTVAALITHILSTGAAEYLSGTDIPVGK